MIALDADEALSPELAREIRDLVARDRVQLQKCGLYEQLTELWKEKGVVE